MTHVERILAITATLVGSACAHAITDPVGMRLELFGLEAPATVAAGAPLVVSLRYGVGPCQAVTAVTGRMLERTFEVEVRGRDVPVHTGTACPDILRFRDTTITAVAPTPGDLTVVGLQPHGTHLVRHVLVTGT